MNDVVLSGTPFANLNNNFQEIEKQIENMSWESLKDKPFGEMKSTVTILEETTLEGQYTDIENTAQYDPFASEELAKLVITLDGVAYECERHLTSEGNIWGDSRLVSYGDTSYPMDVPFGVLAWYDESGMDSIKMWTVYLPEGTTGMHTIKFESMSETVKQLDEKYMPILTSPSGKKFKITVSNSGALSATAV